MRLHFVSGILYAMIHTETICATPHHNAPHAADSFGPSSIPSRCWPGRWLSSMSSAASRAAVANADRNTVLCSTSTGRSRAAAVPSMCRGRRQWKYAGRFRTTALRVGNSLTAKRRERGVASSRGAHISGPRRPSFGQPREVRIQETPKLDSHEPPCRSSRLLVVCWSRNTVACRQ